MPTNRTRTSRSRTAGPGGITEADFIFYSAGDFFEAEGYADNKTEDELRDFWEKHKQTIMARCLEEDKAQGWKGRRPWSWWKWEAPEPKRVVPGRFMLEWCQHRVEYGPYESDIEYLGRLGLLEPWEHE